MKWTDIPHGTITAAEQRLWVAIGDNADVVATRINTDPGFVTRLAGFAVNPPFADKWCTSLNAQWLRAREIMGKNFFGIEEAVQDFGVHPSETQLAALAQVPFTEEVLQSHKDTHILVAVFPLSILDIRGKLTVSSSAPTRTPGTTNRRSRRIKAKSAGSSSVRRRSPTPPTRYGRIIWFCWVRTRRYQRRKRWSTLSSVIISQRANASLRAYVSGVPISTRTAITSSSASSSPGVSSSTPTGTATASATSVWPLPGSFEPRTLENLFLLNP